MAMHPNAFGASLLNNADAEKPEGSSLKQMAVATVATGGAYAIMKAGGAAERATHPQGLSAAESGHMQQDMAEWAAANGISPQRLQQAGGVQDAQMSAATQAPQAQDYRHATNPPAPRRPGVM